jgi:hypothetical protein
MIWARHPSQLEGWPGVRVSRQSVSESTDSWYPSQVVSGVRANEQFEYELGGQLAVWVRVNWQSMAESVGGLCSSQLAVFVWHLNQLVV